jgi:hypothetical protein
VSHSTAPEDAVTAPGDPFVRQVTWLIDTLGGKDHLVRACDRRVSVRTLDNWVRGAYPRQAVTGAVRALDAWALTSVPGYPGAGAPRLIESCGRPRKTAPEADAPVEPDDEPGPPPPDPHQHAAPAWWRHPAVLVGAAVAVVAFAVTITLVVTDRDDEVPVLGVLPSTGNGTLYPEQTGSIGANTFSDPRAVTDRALSIPADTEVQVRCRYYAPSIPSVVPDGFWYLVDSGDWAGRWAPANSFMNGDVPGQATVHNTDFAVPVCT